MLFFPIGQISSMGEERKIRSKALQLLIDPVRKMLSFFHILEWTFNFCSAEKKRMESPRNGNANGGHSATTGRLPCWLQVVCLAQGKSP